MAVGTKHRLFALSPAGHVLGPFACSGYKDGSRLAQAKRERQQSFRDYFEIPDNYELVAIQAKSLRIRKP